MTFRYFLFATLLTLAACSLSPNPPRIVGRMRAPIDYHAVRLYLPQCTPAHYRTVAHLDASRLGNFSSYQANMRWIGFLRRQAAGMGANGLLIIPINQALTIGPIRHGPAFRAQAIWEPPTAAPAAGTSPWAAPCQLTAKQLRYQVSHGSPRPSGNNSGQQGPTGGGG